jgi:hypothetical protein
MINSELIARTSWLMLTKDIRQHGGNLGYDDNASEYYSWDSTVPNATGPKVNDFIAIWNGTTILGAGIIEKIDIESADKIRHRCPSCNQTKIKMRTNIKPKYRCHNQLCKNEFDHQDEELISVTTFKSHHSASWYDLTGLLDAPTLRSLCVQPKSQQSIRPLNWQKFLSSLPFSLSHNLEYLSDEDIMRSGHKAGKTRVRIGQSKFRRTLLEKFGNICAFSGPCHERALDAAHLYSYAQEGVHSVKGGLLIRKDLHRLFDLGLITVNPSNHLITIANSLIAIEQYAFLSSRKISVPMSSEALKWLSDHWEEHSQYLSSI